MIRKALVTSSLALIFGSVSLAEAGPPVKVEVLVEDEDDFFEEKRPAPKSKTDEVREHADQMFDELEREEAKHKNDNTNVVNVVVVDGKKEQEIESPEVTAPEVPDVVVVPDRPLTRQERRALRRHQRQQERMARLAEKQQRRMDKLRIREEKLRLKRQELQLREDLKCQRLETRGWWNRPSWAERGDLLVHGIASGNGQGPYGGIGAEYMLSDMFGVRAAYQFMGLRHDDTPHATGPNFNVSNGGVWANPNDVDYRNLEEGRLHLVDAALAIHVIPESRFDIFPTVGLSYMNYDFEYGNHDEKGGAGYLRVGAGFNIVIKRFYLGMDFGWYPLEIFHHGTDRRITTLESSLLPEREGENEGPRVDDDDDDGRSRFNAKRMSLTAHVGIRF